MVLFADSSELGWRVVNEYMTNPLAGDSEDKRRIYKLEARAIRKAKTDMAKKARRSWPYKRQQAVSVSTSNVQVVSSRQQKPCLCFNSGKPGHWKNECNQSPTQ